MSIPAGEVGNERAIEVVTEIWCSDELKASVLVKHSDPRMGETTTRLSNVRLAEPSKSLFELPTNYKISENPGVRMLLPAMRVNEGR